jgi:predicted dehydrogenase
MVEVAKGVIGRIDLSWSHATQRETYLMVHGTEGSIDVGWRQSRVRLIGQEPRPLPVGVYDKHASHVAMMNAFLAVVSGKRRPWISPGECLRTVAAVEASYHSLRSGGWVPVDTMGVCDTPSRVRARA